MGKTEFHSASKDEIFELLNTSSTGLGEGEVKKRLKLFGRNEIEQRKENIISVFLRQFKNPLIYILLVAALFSVAIGKTTDFLLIAGIVLINGLIGFFQELKALSTLESLKRLTEIKIKVLREGEMKTIPSSLLVPGDIVLLSEGDVVPADMRLIKAEGLLVDESTLTGESIPVDKDAETTLPPDTPIYERSNVLFKGTVVVRGHARGVVFATGKRTELGKLSIRASESSPDTPLTKALKVFSKRWLFILILLLVSLLIIGLWQGRKPYEVALLVIAELVSAVPEGLPIVITLVLVVGAFRLSKRKTYIKHLPAAETLGSTTYIASDKTGTITQGKPKVREVLSEDKEMLFLACALCSNSDGIHGDPLDAALITWLEEENISWQSLREDFPRVKEFPFDVHKRFMATLNVKEKNYTLFVKGAFESVAQLSPDVPQGLKKSHDSMTKKGLRVVAVAYAEIDYVPESVEEIPVKMIGLVGFIDPPKEGVKEAVYLARKAGIKVLMITGDNINTAKTVASEVGIYSEGDWAIEGKQLRTYSDEELFNALRRITVVARALPEDKYRIVRVLQNKGEVVAVTGDGTNDVPALKVADIGIAMGSGTQAAQEAAKMVITDNNLAVIVEAVRLGRIIARNIRRTIHYLLSASFGEVFLISLAFLLKLPFPLYPTQILWINLVTDGVQDKSFPFNKEERDVMSEKPKRPEKVFIDLKQMIDILTTASFTGFINLLLFLFLLEKGNYNLAVSTVFTSLVVNQWIIGIQSVRDMPFLHKPWRNFLYNPFIFLGILAGFGLQWFALYVIPEYMHTQPLSLEEWRLIAITSAGVFAFIELRKIIWLVFNKARRPRGDT